MLCEIYSYHSSFLIIGTHYGLENFAILKKKTSRLFLQNKYVLLISCYFLLLIYTFLYNLNIPFEWPSSNYILHASDASSFQGKRVWMRWTNLQILKRKVHYLFPSMNQKKFVICFLGIDDSSENLLDILPRPNYHCLHIDLL